MRKKRHIFNPEAADPPYGDWPVYRPPLTFNDATGDALMIVWTILGCTAVAVLSGAVIILVWIASMTVEWP